MPWNFHNPSPGVYNFTYGADIVKFAQTAQDLGLYILLRAGPYMCGECGVVWYSGDMHVLYDSIVSFNKHSSFYQSTVGI